MSPIATYIALPKSERRAYCDGLAQVLTQMAAREREWQENHDRVKADRRLICRSWPATIAAWLMAK